MLRSLQIRNYVLIDSLDISFPAGLLIITGQTGAGKSILLGALSLVLGAKADASMVGERADHCVVEAEFASDDPLLREMVEAAGLDWNGGVLTLRRVLGRTGRSRSFCNDEPVTLPVLASLSGRLLDIHSQHQTLLLNDRGFQLSVLDHYAGNAGRLAACREAWQRLGALRQRLAEVTERIGRLALERDFNESLYRQLEQARLRDGELQELEAEQKQLANAEEIKEGLYAVENLLGGDGDERPPLDSQLKEAVRLLGRTARFVDRAQDLSARVESVRLELDDILSEVASLENAVEVAPDRLEAVEDRMSLLYDLMKKHGVGTVAELEARRDALSEAIFDSDALEGERARLEKEIEAVSQEHAVLSRALHEARSAAAGPFAAAIQERLRFLELDRAVFDVVLSEARPGPSGTDGVLFRFSSTGREPVDVAQCASGGELSRIMLCLKAMMARYTHMPTLVFDEIDTGVSGSVADKMGSMICEMGRDMQVFAITHLPQVAAKGDAHFLVTKETDADDRAVTQIRQITGEDRVMEIARMLSGAAVTMEAVANAESLLK